MHIPEIGRSSAEIFDFLKITKSCDQKWGNGRMYAYVCDPGKEAYEPN